MILTAPPRTSLRFVSTLPIKGREECRAFMIRFRAFTATCIAALIAAAAAAAPSWPQAASDLPADPAVKFGVLPNGMRYAVMRNATPAHQTSLRLRIGSGSLEESDAQQGLAHVLEHMAFKGSRHVPAGDMLKILERKGLAFGADTNAETEWTQTVYMLDLPHSEADDIDTGLMLFRETAGELTLDDKALAGERGVVLSEERLRDTPEYRAEVAQIDLFLHGQRAAQRFPIGKIDVIRNAPASLIRSFYEANYRPERATLIAVGDFDPAIMEAKIQSRFSDWRGVGAPTTEPDLGKVEPRGLTVKVISLPGGSTEAQIAWARPYDGSPDRAAKEQHEVIENLALAVLNRRLVRLAQGAHPPFLSADAGFQNLLHSGKPAVIDTTSTPGAWAPALTAAEIEVRRFTTYGVGQAELDREISEMRAVFRNAVAGAATRPTPTLASGLVDAVNDDQVFTAPAEDLALFEATAKGLTAQTVTAAGRAVFAGAGPLVELETPTPVDGGEAAVAAVFAKAAAAPVAARGEAGTIAWPYTHLGPVGEVAARDEVADLGITRVRFANGVGLTIKPTKFRTDQVLVSVDVGGGRLDLPRDHGLAVWSARAFAHEGYGKISYEDAQTALAGKLQSVSFGIGDTAFAFAGATRPGDLATQLQVISAYLADPGFRPEAFERLRGAYLAQLPQLDATPGGVFARDSGGLLTRDDPRFAFPSRAQLEGAKPEDLKTLLAAPLAHGTVEVTIVGDIGVDQAIALSAQTFGALAKRPDVAPRAVVPSGVQFPAPAALPVTLTHTGRADQAIAVIAWPLTDFYADMSKSRAIMLAGEVLYNRLLDRVRIAEGATYSPESRVELSQTLTGYGYAYAQVEMPPRKIPGFFADISAIAADMRDKGVTDDELLRARNPRVANLRKAQMTNEYWIADLSGSLADPRRLDLIRSTFPDYEKVTTSDIQAAAKSWLTDDRAWKLVIEAKPAS